MMCCMFEGSVTPKESVHMLKYAKAEPLAFLWPLECLQRKLQFVTEAQLGVDVIGIAKEVTGYVGCGDFC